MDAPKIEPLEPLPEPLPPSLLETSELFAGDTPNLRDYFAMYALRVVASGCHRRGEDFLRSGAFREVAEDAYELADAMLAAREATGGAPELLDAAKAAEAVLGRQKWLAGSTDPEAIALFKLRAAIAKATGGAS